MKEKKKKSSMPDRSEAAAERGKIIQEKGWEN